MTRRFFQILTRSRDALRKFISRSNIHPFPALQTLRAYQLPDAKKDFRAAIDVALVSIPQGMAFAAMADLPIIYGILATSVPTILAPLFANSRLSVTGPSNATAFMLASFFLANPEYSQPERLMLVPVIVLGVGISLLTGAFLKFAELLQYISRSVLTGYLTGAAVLIMASQFKYLLGINFPLQEFFAENEGGKTLFSLLWGISCNLGFVLWQPLVVGILTLALYFTLKRKFRRLPNFAITLVSASFICWILSQPWTGAPLANLAMLKGFRLSDIAFGLPPIFSSKAFNILFDVSAITFAIAFVSALEQTVMSKTLASRTGRKANINQDIYALGLANIGSSFVPAMPASASLTRSVLNYTSGAATRFACLFCGSLCLASTFLLAQVPATSFIPESVLGALIIGNALSLFDKRSLRICLRSTKSDTAVLLTTFAAALLAPLHVSIFLGAALAIALFLRQAAKPELVEYTFNEEGQLHELGEQQRILPTISIVHVEGDLFFGAADLFRDQIQRVVEDPALKVIILRLKNARNLDATAVMALDDLITFSRDHNRHLVISGASRRVYKILKKSGVLANLDRDCPEGLHNIFLQAPSNPNISTRKALIRAQQLLGSSEADIRIFANESPSAS